MKYLVLAAVVACVWSAAALPLEAPLPVTDTEEVVKAKEEFQAAYKAAAAAAAADTVPEVVIPEGAPAPVEDTEEVAIAKAEFQAAFEAAAAAAEAAPDVDLDGSVSTYTGFLSGVDGRLSPYYTNTLPYGAFGIHAPVAAGAPLVASAPLVTGSSFVARSPLIPGFPQVAGYPLVSGTALVGGPAPVVYSGLGLHGLNFLPVATAQE